jgi:hypothetical protein
MRYIVQTGEFYWNSTCATWVSMRAWATEYTTYDEAYKVVIEYGGRSRSQVVRLTGIDGSGAEVELSRGTTTIS